MRHVFQALSNVIPVISLNWASILEKQRCYCHISNANVNIFCTLVEPIMFLCMRWQQKHCTPAALEMYYTEQQQEQQEEQQEPGLHGSSSNTGLYSALSHLNQVKRIGPELPPPWLPVISALKEAELAKSDGELPRAVMEGEEWGGWWRYSSWRIKWW